MIYTLLQIFITLLLLTLIALLWVEVRRRCARVLCNNGAIEIFTVVEAAGNGCGLEQAVVGLSRVLGDAAPNAMIVILDCGLDYDGRTIARLLARDRRNVTFKTNDRCTGGDMAWRTK